ncbi:hypothetical protein CBR_g29303 [Chara braunii]|uniref:Uncharacterized protein n=1 Tax=Chara braunii TaxID=69332 RepID=A0A388LAN1_CHABU|nr:hypothetical protein CBR_g29303 [Chara braunii]|eukprot:GBG79252.1 hypothetical protein CBR_g29303 [Chara braunii]
MASLTLHGASLALSFVCTQRRPKCETKSEGGASRRQKQKHTFVKFCGRREQTARGPPRRGHGHFSADAAVKASYTWDSGRSVIARAPLVAPVAQSQLHRLVCGPCARKRGVAQASAAVPRADFAECWLPLRRGARVSPTAPGASAPVAAAGDLASAGEEAAGRSALAPIGGSCGRSTYRPVDNHTGRSIGDGDGGGGGGADAGGRSAGGSRSSWRGRSAPRSCVCAAAGTSCAFASVITTTAVVAAAPTTPSFGAGHQIGQIGRTTSRSTTTGSFDSPCNASPPIGVKVNLVNIHGSLWGGGDCVGLTSVSSAPRAASLVAGNCALGRDWERGPRRGEGGGGRGGGGGGGGDCLREWEARQRSVDCPPTPARYVGASGLTREGHQERRRDSLRKMADERGGGMRHVAPCHVVNAGVVMRRTSPTPSRLSVAFMAGAAVGMAAAAAGKGRSGTGLWRSVVCMVGETSSSGGRSVEGLSQLLLLVNGREQSTSMARPRAPRVLRQIARSLLSSDGCACPPLTRGSHSAIQAVSRKVDAVSWTSREGALAPFHGKGLLSAAAEAKLSLPSFSLSSHFDQLAAVGGRAVRNVLAGGFSSKVSSTSSTTAPVIKIKSEIRSWLSGAGGLEGRGGDGLAPTRRRYLVDLRNVVKKTHQEQQQQQLQLFQAYGHGGIGVHPFRMRGGPNDRRRMMTRCLQWTARQTTCGKHGGKNDWFGNLSCCVWEGSGQSLQRGGGRDLSRTTSLMRTSAMVTTSSSGGRSMGQLLHVGSWGGPFRPGSLFQPRRVKATAAARERTLARCTSEAGPRIRERRREPDLSQRVIEFYLRCLQQRPIVTKSVTAGAMAFLSDITAQVLTSPRPGFVIDAARLARMTSFGFFFSGPVLHGWFKLMSHAFPNRDMLSIASKMALGQVVFGPIVVSIFFAVNGALQGDTLNQVINRLHRDLLPTLCAGLFFWPICDAIMFRFIPVHLQPLFNNSASYIWNIYISCVANSSPPVSPPLELSH